MPFELNAFCIRPHTSETMSEAKKRDAAGKTKSSSSSSSSSASSASKKSSSSSSSSSDSDKDVEEDQHSGSNDSDDETYPARIAAAEVLATRLKGMGATEQEVNSWVPLIEEPAWMHVENVAEKTGDYKCLPEAIRLYRSEIRRIASDLKDKKIGPDLVKRLRGGELEAVSIVGIKADDLLPEAKRARLAELRFKAKEAAEDKYPFKDDTMTCPECNKEGARWRRYPGGGQGFAKLDDNENKANKREAECIHCLKTWDFEE